MKSLLQSYRSANKEKGFMVKSDDFDNYNNNDDDYGGDEDEGCDDNYNDDDDDNIIISLYCSCFRKDL